MNTVLLIILINLANPNQPSRIVHKTFESQVACETAFKNLYAEMPVEPTVKTEAFCVKLADLAE